MDLGLQIDLLEAYGFERLGHIGYDRANVFDVLGSRAYHLAGSEYEKGSSGGFNPIDEARELLFIIFSALQLSLDLMQIKLFCQLGGCHHILDIYCGHHTQVSPELLVINWVYIYMSI